ncbi:MAG: lipopolysaccharide transport periplasmic protein LptA [Burkholderiaceae bacterium]|nr:lipopolysaccharide transport periplasmic protein LptA [Burkholderiaceae bacterium]
MIFNSHSFSFRSLIALSLLGLSWCTHAQTPTAKPVTPVEEPSTTILSDTLRYDDTKRESTFTGKVVMTRGLLTLSSDTLSMREDSEGHQYGVATADAGKRVFIRQVRPENFEVLEGVGLKANYDGKNETFDLIGQAVVTRYICGKHFDTVSGQQVRYNQKTDVYQAFSGPDSFNPDGRVRSVAQPKARTDAAIAACQAAQATNPAPSLTPAIPPVVSPRR